MSVGYIIIVSTAVETQSIYEKDNVPNADALAANLIAFEYVIVKKQLPDLPPLYNVIYFVSPFGTVIG